MSTTTPSGTLAYDRPGITQALTTILETMTSDWETGLTGTPGPDTRLIGDLGFESIDIVHLVVAIEEHFNRRDLPFEKLLMTDGRYVSELQFGAIVDFLLHELNTPAGEGPAR